MTHPQYRQAGPGDLERLLPVFLEMEVHYDGADAVGEEVARERLFRALQGQPPGVMIGAFGERALGFASLHEMFPGSGLQSMWYLKELFVTGTVRGLGIGEGLMREAARVLLDRGASRLEFTTDAENASAQRFYRRMRAPVVPKVFYRYEADALSRLAGTDDESAVSNGRP